MVNTQWTAYRYTQIRVYPASEQIHTKYTAKYTQADFTVYGVVKSLFLVFSDLPSSFIRCGLRIRTRIALRAQRGAAAAPEAVPVAALAVAIAPPAPVPGCRQPPQQ